MFIRKDTRKTLKRAGLMTLAGSASIIGMALVGPGAQSFLSGTAQAQEVQVPATAGITVVGDGVARAAPDVASVDVGVEVTAKTPAEAFAQTRERSERVLQRLRELGVPQNDLQTNGPNVYAIHGPVGPNREASPEPVVTGYRGNVTIMARVVAPERVPALLTGALEAGATSIQRVGFGIRDDVALQREALLDAIANARPKAEAAAAASGLTITGVRAIVEQPVGLPRGAALGLGGGGGEGIAPGQTGVSVRVLVTYDVSRP